MTSKLLDMPITVTVQVGEPNSLEGVWELLHAEPPDGISPILQDRSQILGIEGDKATIRLPVREYLENARQYGENMQEALQVAAIAIIAEVNQSRRAFA